MTSHTSTLDRYRNAAMLGKSVPGDILATLAEALKNPDMARRRIIFVATFDGSWALKTETQIYMNGSRTVVLGSDDPNVTMVTDLIMVGFADLPGEVYIFMPDGDHLHHSAFTYGEVEAQMKEIFGA